MKKLLTLLLALALILSFGACGASPKYYNGYDYNSDYMSAEPEESYSYSEETFDSTGTGSESIVESPSPSGRKLIRRFELNVETLEFDAFVSSVKQKVAEYGGYIESSSVSGNSYYSYGSRDASFVCRVPSDRLDEFVNTVGGLGNVTYCYEDSDDVTLNYVDVEARVASLQTEYDRLLELLAEAENIDSIVVLEERLSEVRYQLESYKSQLRTYDNLIDYSTVDLTVMEVKRITEAEPESLGQDRERLRRQPL